MSAIPPTIPPDQPFRAPILAALAASPTLALELSPDELLVSQDDVSKYGVCRRDCLPGLLPEPLWHKLAMRLRGNPAALDAIKKMRPWLASLVVETYDSLSAGLQTEYGTEAQLQNVYLKTRGKIVGLETLPQQMRAFTGLSLAQQREMLAQDLVQTPAQNVADVRALHRLWRVGDADAIAAWQAAKSENLARDKRMSDSIDNKIVYERNRRFVVADAADRRAEQAGVRRDRRVASGRPKGRAAAFAAARVRGGGGVSVTAPVRCVSAHLRHHRRPIPSLVCRNSSHPRIPRRVAACFQPAPVGVGRQQQPHRLAQRARQMRDAGVHGDHQIELHDQRGGVFEAVQIGGEIVRTESSRRVGQLRMRRTFLQRVPRDVLQLAERAQVG